ncbi:HER115Wp [Eremothecium sinecaudum]|uniref:HER115Wp n=1 Tax=Eremothecium sinecaudum TaxID=45286 RepID=A0A0X8HTY5_9SACH|nr:HER115Wp [Eremothecium sinecaudum]AMD21394.1 HER115Wp [Eremothecium sinecaudum]
MVDLPSPMGASSITGPDNDHRNSGIGFNIEFGNSRRIMDRRNSASQGANGSAIADVFTKQGSSGSLNSGILTGNGSGDVSSHTMVGLEQTSIYQDQYPSVMSETSTLTGGMRSGCGTSTNAHAQHSNDSLANSNALTSNIQLCQRLEEVSARLIVMEDTVNKLLRKIDLQQNVITSLRYENREVMQTIMRDVKDVKSQLPVLDEHIVAANPMSGGNYGLLKTTSRSQKDVRNDSNLESSASMPNIPKQTQSQYIPQIVDNYAMDDMYQPFSSRSQSEKFTLDLKDINKDGGIPRKQLSGMKTHSTSTLASHTVPAGQGAGVHKNRKDRAFDDNLSPSIQNYFMGLPKLSDENMTQPTVLSPELSDLGVKEPLDVGRNRRSHNLTFQIGPSDSNREASKLKYTVEEDGYLEDDEQFRVDNEDEDEVDEAASAANVKALSPNTVHQFANSGSQVSVSGTPEAGRLVLKNNAKLAVNAKKPSMLHNVATSGSDDGRPDFTEYTMIKAPDSVQAIWDEYTTGVHGKPSIRYLEQRYGNKWRLNRNKKTFARRNRIYKFILNGLREKKSEKEMIDILEARRKYKNEHGEVKWRTIGWLQQSLSGI